MPTDPKIKPSETLPRVGYMVHEVVWSGGEKQRRTELGMRRKWAADATGVDWRSGTQVQPSQQSGLGKQIGMITSIGEHGTRAEFSQAIVNFENRRGSHELTQPNEQLRFIP